LHAELSPLGVTIVTVCMDTDGAVGARPAIEAANATHPSLVDASHSLGALFGVVNIPNTVWIDEQGVIVRPVEAAWPEHRDTSAKSMAENPDLPERFRNFAKNLAKQNPERERSAAGYLEGLRDWARKGAASEYVLSPDDVVARSQPRGIEQAAAAAHFELAQHLHRSGSPERAVPHFREAHRLQPDNWTYKRQAWELASRVGGPLNRFWQGPVPGSEADWPYDGDFIADVEALDGRAYYPAFQR
jgi:hypothetical protein